MKSIETMESMDCMESMESVESIESIKFKKNIKDRNLKTFNLDVDTIQKIINY